MTTLNELEHDEPAPSKSSKVVRFLINGEAYDLLDSVLAQWPDTMFAVAAEFSKSNNTTTHDGIPLVTLSGDLKAYRILFLYMTSGELVIPPDPVERQLLQSLAGQCCMPTVVAQLMSKTVSVAPPLMTTTSSLSSATVQTTTSSLKDASKKANDQFDDRFSKTPDGRVVVDARAILNDNLTNSATSCSRIDAARWNFICIPSANANPSANGNPSTNGNANAIPLTVCNSTKGVTNSTISQPTSTQDSDIAMKSEEYSARLVFGQDQDGTTKVKTISLFPDPNSSTDSAKKCLNEIKHEFKLNHELKHEVKLSTELPYTSFVYPKTNTSVTSFAKNQEIDTILYAQTLKEFQDQFDMLTFGLISPLCRRLPLVAAGGSVLAALHRFPLNPIHEEGFAALQEHCDANLMTTSYTDLAQLMHKRYTFPNDEFRIRRRFHRIGQEEEDEKQNRIQVELTRLKSIVDMLTTKDTSALGSALTSTDSKDDVTLQEMPIGLTDVKTSNAASKLGHNLNNSEFAVKIARLMAMTCTELNKYGKFKTHMHSRLVDDKKQNRYTHVPIDVASWTANKISNDTATTLAQNLDVNVYRLHRDNNEVDAESADSRGKTNENSKADTVRGILQSLSRTDVDLFLITRSCSEAIKCIVEIDKHIRENIAQNLISQISIMRTEHATTWFLPQPYRNIQVIHRLYYSMEHVLLGFDIDSCCVGYDGHRVVALPRAVRALRYRYNLVDPSRQSTTYEARLVKYAQRGFRIAVEHFNFEAEIKLLVPKLERLIVLPLRESSLLLTKTGTIMLHGLQELLARLYAIQNCKDIPVLKMLFGVKFNDYSANHTGMTTAQIATRIRAASQNKVPLPFVYGKDILSVLTGAECTAHHRYRYGRDDVTCKSSLGETISFQLSRPHTQDRVDVLFTGSFHPTSLDWYGSKVETALSALQS